MQFPTAPAAASFWVPRLYFPNGKLACNCLLLPLQLFRNESLKCDINQDKMQKMQLDTGFNQKCTKKTEEEAFRMLLYGCSWKRCCAIIGQQKKYIHKLHILTTPCSTLISVRNYEEKEWKCVHVSFELVWLDSSLIQHQSPHMLAKSFLDSHQKTEWHKTGSSKSTWVMTSRLLYLSLNFSFSCFTNKQSWEVEALASHISYKSKLWL